MTEKQPHDSNQIESTDQSNTSTPDEQKAERTNDTEPSEEANTGDKHNGEDDVQEISSEYTPATGDHNDNCNATDSEADDQNHSAEHTNNISPHIYRSSRNIERIANQKAPNETVEEAMVNTEVYASIHRILGNAGIRLNEAHTHLSSLRSVGNIESDADREVAEAELNALVESLVETQEQLNNALRQASVTADELDVGVSIDISESQTDQDSSKMLWNTSGK